MMAIQTYTTNNNQQQQTPMNMDTQFNVLMNSREPKGNFENFHHPTKVRW
jgi:hypothetical protein